MSLGGEHRLEEVTVLSLWLLLVACVGGKVFSLAASAIWDLFLTEPGWHSCC